MLVENPIELMRLKRRLQTYSYVHDAAVDVAKLLETEKSSAMSAVIENEALKFPMSTLLLQLGGSTAVTVVA